MTAQHRLTEVLSRYPHLAVAVSGGVDSVMLASFLHRISAGKLLAVHAVSPAVPTSATDRVKRYALEQGWKLAVVGAGEFDDENYRSNPSNRCYFCKSHLYDRIRSITDWPIASGANCDDLGDYRPGLLAARERDVVHPLIDAGLHKADIRALARELNLTDLSELAAQPCLASRIETGRVINPDELAIVDKIEAEIRAKLAPGAAIRCRVSNRGVHLELDGAGMSEIEYAQATAEQQCRDLGLIFLGVRPYKMGSMFLR